MVEFARCAGDGPGLCQGRAENEPARRLANSTAKGCDMAIERWRPLGTLMERGPFRDIQSEMNRLFDSFMGRPMTTASGTGSRSWEPLVDLYETPDDFVLNFELPGVSEKDIALSITGDVITVQGERPFSEPLNDDSYFHVERAYGKFARSLRLPMPVDARRVRATYREGVLQVRVPKAEEVRAKEIKIDVASGGDLADRQR
jgi:HSP20 family protein